VGVPGRDWYDAAAAPRDQIGAYARKVLAEFAGTDVWDPAAQLRAASVHAGDEYAGRFLLELLQNAHDTHAAERHDGRITIIVDADEGAYGVVYVANAGTPFTYRSMAGLCKLARSPKPVGEGIGHKGVGFRSILPVCSWPEIYSADPAGKPGNLSGYTFRFARHADLLTLADGDEALANRAADEFPPFQLPVPADIIPDSVRDLAAAGHVTVVRLPLDAPGARTEALTQAARLAASDVPVLLFLERISSLTVICRDSDTATETILTRAQRPLGGVTASQVSFACVDLGDLGAYTVASAPVAADRLHDAVGAARDARRMSADWDGWDDAVVSLAVPAEDEVTGRMFTFLPMGEKAPSPFAGHLNAPFFTKLDRADLDPGHPLNDLLLDVAAETALAAATAVQASGVDAARRWVSDLVCWNGPYRQRLTEAADRSGGGALIERPFVPIVATAGHDPGWASLTDSYRWPAGSLKVLTAARAAEDGTCLLDSTLSRSRINRWEDTAAKLDCPLSPDAGTLARLVERITASLERPAAYDDTHGVLRTRRPKKRNLKATRKPSRTRPRVGDSAPARLWSGVYSDLAALFATEAREVLRGRLLLVDDAGELRPANTAAPPPGERSGDRRASAFLPPARDDTPVAVPASLRQHLFYLHPAIAEQLESAGRAFLVDANLAYRYDSRTLLEHISAVLARSRSDRVHRDALRFAFTIEQNGQIPPRHPLTQLRLQVPSAAGPMVRAASAAFGPGWAGRDGSDLAAVIEDAGDLDRALAAFADRLVDPTSELVRPGDSLAAWSSFLAKIGVVDGLPVHVTAAPTPKLWGWQLRGPQLARGARVPDLVAQQWAAHLAARPPRTIAYPQTEYVANRKPVWAVGQTTAEQLTDPARDAYARLILHGLSRWPADYLTFDWDRDRSCDKNRQAIPTPLAAFLATAAWLPAAPRPGRPTFGRPDQLWHFPLSSDDAEPAFAPLVNRATRVYLDAHPRVLATLQTAGLGVWSDPSHAARLVRDLGEAAGAGAVGDGQRDQFVRAYMRAWSNVANHVDPNLGPAADLQLVLREGPRLSVRRVADLAADNVTVHLARPGDGLHLRLLDELELPVLLVDANLEGARRALAGGLGDRVRIVDETSVTVTPTGVTNLGELLVGQLRWLAVLVAVAADHGRGLTLQERDFEDLARQLRRVRIRTYTTLGLSLFDQPTELPTASCGLFAEPDSADPVILAPTAARGLTGPALVAFSEQLAVAVGYAGLQERLRAAVLELQQGGNDQPDPDDADIARALRLTPSQVAATRARLDGGLESVISRLYPLLVHWAGRGAAETAVDTARAAGELADLAAALAPLTSSLPVTLDTLITAARTAATDEELRSSVGVGFADFNITLASLSPEYAPVSHQAAHEQALRQHLALNHRNLCDQLRWARILDFDARRPQADWPDLRSFDWVTVPQAWGTAVDEATRADLTDLVVKAVEARLGYPPPVSGPALPALDTVAAANKARVTRAGADVARLARAWANSHRVTLTSALSSDDPGAEIVTLFDGNGVLDFRDLSDDDIPAWLDALDWWPADMPATTDPATAGVTAEELASADSVATVARRDRERQRRLVRIGGHEIDVGVGASDMAALIDALQVNLDANPAVIAAPNRMSDLQPMPATRPSTGGGGSGGSRDPMAGLSDEQRQALGFAGEWLAYQWLTRQYPEANESSWVSTNRRRVFAGHAGNDSLGFDFRVERARGPIMFEVKASRDDPGMFTLTDSEIREARRHARDGRWRLLIVPFVSDPARCRVLRLPNPFEARAEGLFRAEGEGIRYRYRLHH
jgi:hypothetical protein